MRRRNTLEPLCNTGWKSVCDFRAFALIATSPLNYHEKLGGDGSATS
jgi:hypothetical protein